MGRAPRQTGDDGQPVVRPVAQLDVSRPLPAAGIGGLATRSGKGLTVQWRGLQGGTVRLTNPWILCDPGHIGITELKANNPFYSGEWADVLALIPFAVLVVLLYLAGREVILASKAARAR